MSDWIKFDAKNPETWPGKLESVIAYSTGLGWSEMAFNNAEGDIWFSVDGLAVPAKRVTHYMIPTKPSDHVSVPRELSDKDAIKLSLKGSLDLDEVIGE